METISKRILVVDDVQENTYIVSTILKNAGYTALVAHSGKQAIQIAEKEHPDLMLLDINMPEMNGYDVCKYFKETPGIADIPIVFLTVHTDADSIARAFDNGAVDYLTKPFKKTELLARVKVHLALRQAQEQLEENNERLQRLNEEKNEFLGIAAHDLKNPLNTIRGMAQMIRKRHEIGMSTEELDDIATQIETSSNLMFEIIRNLLDINRIENGNLVVEVTTVNLGLSLYAVLERYQGAAAKKHIALHTHMPEHDIFIYADPTLTVQILDNLVSNAVKYSPINTNVWIRVQPYPERQRVRVSVQDEGPGLSEEDKQKLFHKFARLSAKPTGGEHSTGLGLSIVKRLAEAIGANVWCESELGKGATFIIEFLDDTAASLQE
ncbi:MAG: hybrid sensor histidine kinase/response regulator [Bacteroidota bacterium]|nr:hybrid sensor histidine kinase/response regulator [Candidatus Kapabacteria bacterium]MDW8219171.1 hybrid sensor histidine kinase/response regulator [Bacteroidota bacterium]